MEKLLLRTGSYGEWVGKLNQKTEAWPGLLVAEIERPCTKMIALAIASPAPVPCIELFEKSTGKNPEQFTGQRKWPAHWAGPQLAIRVYL